MNSRLVRYLINCLTIKKWYWTSVSVIIIGIMTLPRPKFKTLPTHKFTYRILLIKYKVIMIISLNAYKQLKFLFRLRKIIFIHTGKFYKILMHFHVYASFSSIYIYIYLISFRGCDHAGYCYRYHLIYFILFP